MAAELGEEKFAALLCVARDCVLGRVESSVIFPDPAIQRLWEQTKITPASNGRIGTIDCR